MTKLSLIFLKERKGLGLGGACFSHPNMELYVYMDMDVYCVERERLFSFVDMVRDMEWMDGWISTYTVHIGYTGADFLHSLFSLPSESYES